MRRKVLAGTAAVAVLALGAGGGYAVADRADDDGRDRDDAPVRAQERASAGAAATRAEPGTAVAVDREDGGFEVDVRRGDGTIVEVTLDGRLQVTGVDAD